MKKCFFLKFPCERRGQNYSITIGPQFALQQVVLRTCFSVKMASRFDVVDEEYIEELKNKSENENTKNSTGCW